ncbi:MAG: hypothetical protein WCJ64_08830 [Rhodospirillaceae bacterium]
MDVSTDPGAALMLRMGPAQQGANLSAIKHEAQTETAVATMAMQTVASSSDPNRGQNLDTRV